MPETVSVALPSVSASTLTFGAIMIFLAVLLLFVDVYIKISTAIKTYREEKNRKERPVTTLEEQVKTHEEKLKNDHERLKELEDGNRIMMRAMMAILSHDINGNSTDSLKKSLEEIQKYLIDK